MTEVESMNMVEEQDHPMNHRLGEEDMNIVGIHMVQVGGMDMVDEHYHPMNHPLEVEGINREDSGMGEDMMVELEVVEREPEGVVLAMASFSIQWSTSYSSGQNLI
jgi:hypothetical protein